MVIKKNNLNNNHKIKLFLYHLFFVCATSLLLTGCGRKQYSTQATNESHTIVDVIDTVDVVYHIPIPFEAVLISSWMQEQQVNCTSQYRVYADIDSVKDFYMRHMDQAGWHCSKLFETPSHIQIIFYSPMHVCSISISYEQPEALPMLCVIHVGPALVRPVTQTTNA